MLPLVPGLPGGWKFDRQALIKSKPWADAKRRPCHSLLNSTAEIRHYQLRGTSHFPHATSTAWASLLSTMVYKRLSTCSSSHPRSCQLTSCHSRPLMGLWNPITWPISPLREYNAGCQARKRDSGSSPIWEWLSVPSKTDYFGSSNSQNLKSKLTAQKAVEWYCDIVFCSLTIFFLLLI